MHIIDFLSHSPIRKAARSLLTGAVIIASTTIAIAQALPDDAQRQVDELERVAEAGAGDSLKQISGEDIHGRAAWFHFVRSFPYGQVPANGRVEALRASDRISSTLARGRAANGGRGGLMSASLWQAIGPANVGGRVRAIAIHPTRAGVILIGSAAGGVWKTTNSAQTWTPTFDKESAIAVNALAFDYSNPNIVYAGTGENYNNPPTLLTATPAYLGDGIFKSTDEGVTWNKLSLETNGAVSKIFVHRQNPSIVYAVVNKQNGGFYRSTDAGATWTRTNSGESHDMTVDPGNSDVLYITYPSGIRKSTNAGLTFVNASSGINTSGGVRYSISLSAADPSRLYVLAARGGSGSIAEIYRSTNSGSSWEMVLAPDENFFRSQGTYDNFIVANPGNPDIALAGGIDVWRTEDGGETWVNITRAYGGGPVAGGDNVHPDMHVAEFDPTTTDVAVLGCDGGLYLSLDAGMSWNKQSAGLAITQFYRLGVDQTRPFRVYGGTQDNGTQGTFGTTSFSTSWNSVLGGDGFFVIMDESDPSYFFGEIYYGKLYRINANNPSDTRRMDVNIPDTGPSADLGAWATPIAMSSVDRKSLYSGRRNLWRTTNRGGAWTSINAGTNAKLSAIGLSPFDAKKIIVGAASGGIRYSLDYGVTWASGSGLPSSVVIDIRFDPVAPNRAYAVYSGFGNSHVLRSDDNGATWDDISNNLPKIPVNAIDIDPADNNRLFIGTDVGAFFSPNGGAFWLPFNEGLPLAPVSDVRIHRSSRFLIASTHGRSMFRVSIDNITVEPALIAPVGGERITTPSPLEVHWFGFSGPVNVSIKYSADEPFQVIASNVTGDRVTLQIPMRQSTTARVRVEEIGSGRTVTSGMLTLITQSNATPLGKRGFIAEAIEMRDSLLWATARGTDSIFRLRLPLLTGAAEGIRTTVPGHIRDLAYNAAADEFFALVTADDFSGPQIYRMDTSGVSLGALALPSALTSAVGITMHEGALAVITPMPNPTIWLLDPLTGTETDHMAIENAVGTDRRALVWNGRGYVQAVSTDSVETGFGAELQQISAADTPRVFNRVPIVLSTSAALRVFGLAYDVGISGVEYYFATDTSGSFYRFRADILSGINDDVMRSSRGSVLDIRVGPNPIVTSARALVEVARAGEMRMQLVDATGALIKEIANARVEAGAHEFGIDATDVASGLYYLVVEINGDRGVHAVTIVR